MQTSSRALACLLAAALTGCAQLLGGDAQLPQRHFYKIRAELLRADWEHSARPYPFRVQVKGFEVPRAYNRSDIIIRRDEYELRRSRQHSWMERPGDMLTDVIKEYLRQADLFTYIGGDRDFYEHRPDYVLSGSIKAIERFDSGDAWVAHLAMTIELMRQEDGRVVWQTDFDDERPVFSAKMKYAVEALSLILVQQMEKAIRELDFTFAQQQGIPIVPTARPAPAAQDTAAPPPRTTGYYEILPGKRAP